MSKKYLLIMSSFDMGGAERQAFNLACYLQSAGREVMVVSYRKGDIIPKLCEEKNIKYFVLDAPDQTLYFILRALRKLHIISRNIRPFFEALALPLARLIQKEGYDICISYCTEPNIWLGASTWYYKKATYIWYQRDAGIFNAGDSYEKKLIDRFDLVLANGESGKQYLEKTFHRSVTVLRNGVELSPIIRNREEWRKILQITDEYKVCTMVANLHSAKDHESILKIWNLMSKKKFGLKALLVFAGRKDDTYEALEKYVKENDLNDSVRFLGAVEDVTGLLNVTDICVFGAKAEGSPNGIIEAALMKLPVVATDLPEIREVVSEENLPFLFRKEDYNFASDKLYELCIKDELRQMIGEKNREKCMEMYDVKVNFGKLIKLAEGIK